MKGFEYELGLTIAAIVAAIFIANAFHNFDYQTIPIVQVVETPKGVPTIQERIEEVIEDCRRDDPALDGACLTYDHLRRIDPGQAKQLVAKTPGLAIYADAITRIETAQ